MSESDLITSIVPPAEAIRDLLATAGLRPHSTCTPLTGGANNRTYRLDTEGGPVLLKWYFSHPRDGRDRLQAEVAFTRFAREHGIDAVPRPLAHDDARRLALFEFIEGRRLTEADVSGGKIDGAIAFVRQLADCRDAPGAAALPEAAEACFSLEEHADCIRRRLDRLAQISNSDGVDRDAAEFVRLQLAPAGRQAVSVMLQAASCEGVSAGEPLPQSERCLSPSDFGYHNAIETRDGELRFVDFEYAGWDDPAKLVCDFFHQVQVPVPKSDFERFSLSICRLFDRPEILRRRIELLMPVFGIKWCCIVLNEFLPTSAERRSFSGGPDRADERERKARQLEKSRELLASLCRD